MVPSNNHSGPGEATSSGWDQNSCEYIATSIEIVVHAIFRVFGLGVADSSTSEVFSSWDVRGNKGIATHPFMIAIVRTITSHGEILDLDFMWGILQPFMTCKTCVETDGNNLLRLIPGGLECLLNCEVY
jgi:hypothetical protein